MTYVSGTTLNAEANLTFDGTNLALSGGELILSGNSGVRLDKSISAAEASGTKMYFGGGTLIAGSFYFLNSSGNWDITLADDESTTKGLLCWAIGTSATSDGVLLNGILYLASHSFTVGAPLYLSQNDDGELSTSAPGSSGEVARVVGYAIDSDHIYFNPDNVWVELN